VAALPVMRATRAEIEPAKALPKWQRHRQRRRTG
jgi:hypothetical protein